jgi:hypothetical protein
MGFPGGARISTLARSFPSVGDPPGDFAAFIELREGAAAFLDDELGLSGPSLEPVAGVESFEGTTVPELGGATFASLCNFPPSSFARLCPIVSRVRCISSSHPGAHRFAPATWRPSGTQSAQRTEAVRETHTSQSTDERGADRAARTCLLFNLPKVDFTVARVAEVLTAIRAEYCRHARGAERAHARCNRISGGRGKNNRLCLAMTMRTASTRYRTSRNSSKGRL